MFRRGSKITCPAGDGSQDGRQTSQLAFPTLYSGSPNKSVQAHDTSSSFRKEEARNACVNSSGGFPYLSSFLQSHRSVSPPTSSERFAPSEEFSICMQLFPCFLYKWPYFGFIPVETLFSSTTIATTQVGKIELLQLQEKLRRR